MKVKINTTELIKMRIEQLLKLKKYSLLKEQLHDIAEDYVLFNLDEKEVVHCDFINALLKSRIPMNITY